MWIERYRAKGEIRRLHVDQLLVSVRSRYQQIEVVETTRFGRTLVLDRIPQSSSYDEHIYHELLVHPAMLGADEPTRVLVIGGGEGATLREVLKHPSVERAVMVDIDSEVIGVCRRYLPDMNGGAFDDPRVKLIIADAAKYLSSTSEKFDTIIVDLSDPIPDGPAAHMLSREIFENACQVLSPNGVLAIQAEPAGMGIEDAHCALLILLRRVFRCVVPLYEFIPLYGTPYGFAVASDKTIDASSLRDVGCRALGAANLTLRHLDAEALCRALLIPRNVRDRLLAVADEPHHAERIAMSDKDLGLL